MTRLGDLQRDPWRHRFELDVLVFIVVLAAARWLGNSQHDHVLTAVIGLGAYAQTYFRGIWVTPRALLPRQVQVRLPHWCQLELPVMLVLGALAHALAYMMLSAHSADLLGSVATGFLLVAWHSIAASRARLTRVQQIDRTLQARADLRVQELEPLEHAVGRISRQLPSVKMTLQCERCAEQIDITGIRDESCFVSCPKCNALSSYEPVARARAELSDPVVCPDCRRSDQVVHSLWSGFHCKRCGTVIGLLGKE